MAKWIKKFEVCDLTNAIPVKCVCMIDETGGEDTPFARVYYLDIRSCETKFCDLLPDFSDTYIPGAGPLRACQEQVHKYELAGAIGWAPPSGNTRSISFELLADPTGTAAMSDFNGTVTPIRVGKEYTWSANHNEFLNLGSFLITLAAGAVMEVLTIEG